MRAAHSLTRTQIRQLERELRSERARLERSMSSCDTDDITADSGEPSSAASHADGGLALALEPRALARHEVLGDALRRLEDGSYGVCASCGTSIPFGRLLVMPETTRCMSCGPRA